MSTDRTVEQPERQGEAPAWNCGACGQRNTGWATECGRCETPKTDAALTTNAARAAVDTLNSLGRADDGVEALAADVREALDRQACPDHYMRLAYETVVANAVRRLRPQVSGDVTGSLERIRLAADNGGLNEGQCYSIWRALTAALNPEADSHG